MFIIADWPRTVCTVRELKQSQAATPNDERAESFWRWVFGWFTACDGVLLLGGCSSSSKRASSQREALTEITPHNQHDA
jgi:hypothetical protein